MKIEKISITRNDICDLLTMEAGGFNYWGHTDYDEEDYQKAREEMQKKKIKSSFDDDHYCYEDVLAYMIFDTNYRVCIYDFEDGTEHQLTKEMCEQGFLLNAQHNPTGAISLDDDKADSTTGDCILQYAIFGDLIYG